MKTMILVSVLAFAGFASAGELILTQEAGKGGTVVALDLLSSGDAASVDFAVDTGIRGNDSSIDVSNCGANGSGRVSKCVVQDGVVYGGYFTPASTSTAKGALSLGSFSIKASGAKATVKTFTATDGAGKEVPASVATVNPPATTK